MPVDLNLDALPTASRQQTSLAESVRRRSWLSHVSAVAISSIAAFAVAAVIFGRSPSAARSEAAIDFIDYSAFNLTREHLDALLVAGVGMERATSIAPVPSVVRTEWKTPSASVLADAIRHPTDPKLDRVIAVVLQGTINDDTAAEFGAQFRLLCENLGPELTSDQRAAFLMLILSPREETHFQRLTDGLLAAEWSPPLRRMTISFNAAGL